MFKILRILLSAAIAAVIILIILYFLPTNIKLKGLETVTGIVPQSIKENVEELILTPPEKRARILEKLKTNLEQVEKITLEDKPSDVISRELRELKETIRQSKELVKQLEEKNEDASITNIVTSKLVDTIIGETRKKNIGGPGGNNKKESSKPDCQCQ